MPHDTDQIANDVRVTLLETLIKKLIVDRCCHLDPTQSADFKRRLCDTSSKYDYTNVQEPTAVDEVRSQALAFHCRDFFDDVESREQETRQHAGLPRADPMY